MMGFAPFSTLSRPRPLVRAGIRYSYSVHGPILSVVICGKHVNRWQTVALWLVMLRPLARKRNLGRKSIATGWRFGSASLSPSWLSSELAARVLTRLPWLRLVIWLVLT